MRKSWISIQLEMADFPYIDYSQKLENNFTDPNPDKTYKEVKKDEDYPQLDKYL